MKVPVLTYYEASCIICKAFNLLYRNLSVRIFFHVALITHILEKTGVSSYVLHKGFFYFVSNRLIVLVIYLKIDFWPIWLIVLFNPSLHSLYVSIRHVTSSKVILYPIVRNVKIVQIKRLNDAAIMPPKKEN